MDYSNDDIRYSQIGAPAEEGRYKHPNGRDVVILAPFIKEAQELGGDPWLQLSWESRPDGDYYLVIDVSSEPLVGPARDVF